MTDNTVMLLAFISVNSATCHLSLNKKWRESMDEPDIRNGNIHYGLSRVDPSK